MKDTAQGRKGLYGRLGDAIERRSGWLIVGTVLVTLLLLLPLSMMKPDEIASDNPRGSDVVEWNEEIDDEFSYEVYTLPFIVEAMDGDMLTQRNLYELFLNQAGLREGSLASFLYRRYSDEAGVTIDGLYSMADAVNDTLVLGSGGDIDLSNATDLQVKRAVHHVLTDTRSEGMEVQLSVKADYEEEAGGIRLWRSPALLLLVESDNAKVKTEYPESVGEDYSEELALEHFGREVQDILRGDEQGYRLWGVFIDLNLEIADEGRISGLMMMVAIVLMLVLISFIFRSWLLTLVSGIGLGMLIIWLKGFSNLIGLNSSMTLDLIVPVMILVLGIDYAIHALFRYREERERGRPPRQALGNSTYGVGSALVLAMLTTVIAFGSNAVSGIESVMGFAIAASFAIFASMVILGLFAPAVVMRYEVWRRRTAAPSNSVKAAVARGRRLSGLVSRVSNRWFYSLPLVIAITAAAAIGWINLDTKLDPKEAFDSKSDLIVGLDKLDEHVSEKAGEPAHIYIKGDFTQAGALEAMRATVREMEDDENVARRMRDGMPDAYTPLLDYLEAVVGNDYARSLIEAASGVQVTDLDGDFIPDGPEQLRAVFDYIISYGVPLDEESMQYTPQRIGEDFITSGEEGRYSTLIIIGVPGTREQAIVKESAVELQQDMDAAMQGVSGIDFYGLTGEAYVRDVQFDAITSSLSRSLFIAVIACIMLLVVVFRSLKYAVATLVPVLLVACWLYGFMYIAGYHLNMITATIAAISIGVGIDFSIHFTERFRQELGRGLDKKSAIVNTARSTGMALFGTALSTAVGFAVIAFAPMPMFASFGLLTAVMIVISFLMALFVLPCLLLLLSPAEGKAEQR
ncbi:RND family transporter [Chloroflexota bacterium]